MSDRIFLALIGLAFGVMTFAAIGVVTSLVMIEVQGRHTLDVRMPSAPTVYAQNGTNAKVAR